MLTNKPDFRSLRFNLEEKQEIYTVISQFLHLPCRCLKVVTFVELPKSRLFENILRSPYTYVYIYVYDNRR